MVQVQVLDEVGPGPLFGKVASPLRSSNGNFTLSQRGARTELGDTLLMSHEGEGKSMTGVKQA